MACSIAGFQCSQKACRVTMLISFIAYKRAKICKCSCQRPCNTSQKYVLKHESGQETMTSKETRSSLITFVVLFLSSHDRQSILPLLHPRRLLVSSSKCNVSFLLQIFFSCAYIHVLCHTVCTTSAIMYPISSLSASSSFFILNID